MAGAPETALSHLYTLICRNPSTAANPSGFTLTAEPNGQNAHNDHFQRYSDGETLDEAEGDRLVLIDLVGVEPTGFQSPGKTTGKYMLSLGIRYDGDGDAQHTRMVMLNDYQNIAEHISKTTSAPALAGSHISNYWVDSTVFRDLDDGIQVMEMAVQVWVL